MQHSALSPVESRAQSCRYVKTMSQTPLSTASERH